MINITKEEILKHKFPNIIWDNPNKVEEWYDWFKSSDLDKRQKFFSIVGRLPNEEDEYEIEIFWYVLASKLEERTTAQEKILNKVEHLEQISKNFHEQATKITRLTNEEILFILHEMWEEINKEANMDMDIPSEEKLVIEIHENFLKNCLEKYKK